MTNVVEESGTLDRLEQLQHHSNEDIYKAAYALLEEFFSDEAAVAANPGTSTQKRICFMWRQILLSFKIILT